MGQAAVVEADDVYQRNVFQAKVYAAIRKAESEADFMQFQVYRMRVFEGAAGKQVAEQLGISEPTVSRHLQRVRQLLRGRLAEVVTLYSFTPDESAELERAGLGHAGGDTLSPGNRQFLKYSVEPGTYALICFFPDPNNPGSTYVADGMVRIISMD